MKMNVGLIASIAVILIASATRLLFLSSIHDVVFDEVHFGKFISSYCCTGERFFDIHPPVGKLLIAGGAYLAGYTGNFSFESIGQTYAAIPIAGIRSVPALAGAALSFIVYVLLRQVGVSASFSFLGALAIALDNALIVESRFIITDSILLSAIFGALAFVFACIKSEEAWASFAYAVLAGALSGIAVGTKFTGLVGGAIVCMLLLHRAYQGKSSEAGVWILRLAAAIAAGAAVYLLGWMLHFSLLTKPGSGDAWGIPTGAFWTDVTAIHQQMVSANYNLSADHPYGSKWWTWPFMVRSVFYWQGQGNEFIYLLGNPIVWWGSFLFLCYALMSLFVYVATGAIQELRKMLSGGAWIFIVGYFLSFIPLMRVPRVLFLYHYLTPLIFSLLIGIWWLDYSISPAKKRIVLVAGSMCIAAGFIFISPLTYGIQLSDSWYNLLFMMRSWR